MKKNYFYSSILLLVLLSTSLFVAAQSGRVGIGTSNPEQKLDVAGSAKANDKVIGTRGFVAGSVTTDTAKAVFSTDITNKGFYIPRLTTTQKNTLGGSLTLSNKGLLVFDTDSNRTDFWDGTAWKAIGDGVGGSPSGAAGGDLTGSYPAPSIANNAVNSAKIADGTIVAADLNQMGAGTGQVLQWNGSAWVPTTPSAGTVTSVSASNGLNSSGGSTPDIKLGGTLANNTDVALNGNKLTFSGTGNSSLSVGTGIGSTTARLYAESGSSSYDAIRGTNTASSGSNTFAAIRGNLTIGAAPVTNIAFHSTTDKTFGVYSTGGDYSAWFAKGVGIGSNQPTTTADLEVRNIAGSNPANFLLRQTASNTTAGTVLANINVGDNYNTSPQAQIQVLRDAASSGSTDLPTAITLSTTADGTSTLTEQMRIDNAGNVGIKTPSPTSALDVNGNVRIRGGSPAAGKVLVSTDANGNATWSDQAISASANASTGGIGWKRIAHIDGINGRGFGTVTLYTSGGSYTPTMTTLDWFKDWGTVGGIEITSQSTSAYWSDARVTYDGSANAYIEVNFTTDVSSLSLLSSSYGYHTATLYSGTLPTGGGTVTATAKIGRMNIGENDLFVDYGGNVGIGTSTPAANLESYSNTNWSSGWRNNLRLSSADYPALRFFSTSSNKTSMIGNNGDGSLWFGINGTGDASGGGWGMVMLPDGKVGVGITAPTVRLHADWPTYNQEAMRVSYANNAHSGGLGVEAYSTYWGLGIFQDGVMTANFENGGMAIGPSYAQLNAPTNGLAIQGNVGIGTNNPASNLDISSTNGSPMYLRSSAAESDITYEVPSGAWQVGSNASGNGTSGNQFYVWDNNGAGYVTTFQRGSGNVGIGSTAPGERLDVNGNIRAAGSVYAGYTGSYAQTYLHQWGLGGNGDIYVEPASGKTLYLTDSWSQTGQLNIQFGSTYFASGNVGIGVSPNYKLDVAGNIVNSVPTNGYLALTGDLPGYANNIYPTLKTNGSYMYVSIGGVYSAYVSAGGTWTAVSSRKKKENIETIDKQDILKRINTLELKKWNYKCESPDIKHIGPFAEDFHQQFGLNGTNDSMISYTDPAGVALVGIQALTATQNTHAKQIEELNAKIQTIEKGAGHLTQQSYSADNIEMLQLKKEIAELRAMLEKYISKQK
ncbi:MAG: tail fiber domain-containing protein [Chitinophagales bacterium]|nr:tail fiber domain-containing protein [Chitinophagales bacterium]